jgi:long-chain acyl-CoA synthetase
MSSVAPPVGAAPAASLGLETASDIFLRLVDSHRDAAILCQQPDGSWRPISTGDVYARVHALARAFQAWGISKGDRVAILAENRWEWAVTDFATLALGIVNVPIYPTLTVDQTTELLADSGSRIAVVSTREQYAKVAAARGRTSLERIIVMDDFTAESGADAVPFSSLMPATAPEAERDAEFDAIARSVRPEDLATIIYTSGTTGEPKGVMLTHGNIASNVSVSTIGIDLREGDRCISFLPLSHITARHLDFALFTRNATVAYCASFDKLPAAMQAVRPTVLVGVPRVYEKIRQEVERRASRSALKKRLLRWAIATGHRHREVILEDHVPKSRLWRLAAKLVLVKIYGAFGGRVRFFIAGGAPLGMDTAGWYADAGIRILEGYGLTETSPVIAGTRWGAAGAWSVHFQGLLESIGGDRQGIHSGRLVPHWRHRQIRSQWLSFHHRPEEGADQDFRRQVHRPPGA